MKNIITRLSIFAFAFSCFSCNVRIFTKKENVLSQSQGILILMDNESRINRNASGDVFTDSLIGDIFIPVNNIGDKMLTEKDIEQALFNKSKKSGYFFYLFNNCDDKLRSSFMEQGTPLSLDQNIDSYLKSNKIFVLPVSGEFKREYYSSPDYYKISNLLNLKYKGEEQQINLKKGSITFTYISLLGTERMIQQDSILRDQKK